MQILVSLIKNVLKLLFRYVQWNFNGVQTPNGEITVERYLLKNEAKKAKLLSISETSIVKERLPVSVNSSLPSVFHSLTRRIVPASFILSLPNARVWGAHGAVVSYSNYLLKDITQKFGDKDKPHLIFNKIFLKKQEFKKGKIAVLATCGSNVYYHWLFDVLPRLFLLQRKFSLDEVDGIILDFTDLPFQRETLELLNFDFNKLIRSNNNWDFHIEAENLLVPSLPSTLGTINKWQCEFLRSSFLPSTKTQKFGKYVYISRGIVGRRTIANEEELLPLLSRLDFQIFNLEQLSFTDQVNLFSNADVVVGPHGSGFSNIVFCKPGTTIIDIQHPDYINTCFWILSNQLNLCYHLFFGECGNNNSSSDDNKNKNIFLNLADLEKILQPLICI
ncbi:glycosyltransferase family 61 protein [Pontibacter cellulosilyticus]|uniref:Glycosyltransferase family 61 protein n=1 Tax=Pontibacter cellulosilyticus TaxID=1720253 RepID=A0A923SIF6_9BACT|nr:glycosyltransferase family 61 protein [Pontibacter cellulosilyticus]MBC5991616.1 glycosyltransferase family 61 protein [Pontibacter cellulosilyticus]